MLAGGEVEGGDGLFFGEFGEDLFVEAGVDAGDLGEAIEGEERPTALKVAMVGLPVLAASRRASVTFHWAGIIWQATKRFQMTS